MLILLDEDFNNDIMKGLLRRDSTLDLSRVQDIPELVGQPDPVILEWAAAHGYIVFTHDAATMTKHAYDRVREGKRMLGIFEVRQSAPIREVIEDILIVIGASDPDEWEGQVNYIPMR